MLQLYAVRLQSALTTCETLMPYPSPCRYAASWLVTVPHRKYAINYLAVKDKNAIYRDPLVDLNAHAAGYLYVVIHGALCPAHITHRLPPLPHVVYSRLGDVWLPLPHSVQLGPLIPHPSCRQVQYQYHGPPYWWLSLPHRVYLLPQ